jgi:hypothetical protein
MCLCKFKDGVKVIESNDLCGKSSLCLWQDEIKIEEIHLIIHAILILL